MGITLLDPPGRRAKLGAPVDKSAAQPRPVVTSAGAAEVIAPRVKDKRIDPDTGERMGVHLAQARYGGYGAA